LNNCCNSKVRLRIFFRHAERARRGDRSAARTGLPGRKGILASSILVLIVALYSVKFPAFAQDEPGLASFQFREDFNRDGRVTVTDVLALLIKGQKSSGDLRFDYDQDGAYNLNDVLSLLVNIVKNDLSVSEPTASSWRNVGPGGGGGQFLPTINPANPDNVFERCDMTGAYVSYDNAESWRMFNLRSTVRDFEFDPSSPSTVYAASTGLYRSDNGGLSWRLIFPDPAEIIEEHMEDDHAGHWFETEAGVPEGEQSSEMYKVRVDPADSRHLWLVRSSPWGDSYRILVSNDRANSWSRLVTGLESRVLAVFPGSWWGSSEEAVVITEQEAFLVSETTGQATALSLPDSPVVAADGGKGEQGVLFYMLANDRVYLSTDYGAGWQSAGAGDLVNGKFNTMAVCESRPEVAYLACSEYPGYQFGIFKTSNSGTNWAWVYRADGDGVLTNNLNDKGWLDLLYGPSWRGNALSVGVCPTNSDICYVTDYGGTIRTLDGGANWDQVYSHTQPDGSSVTRGLDVTGSYTVQFDPFDSLHIFMPTTDIGAFQSFNGGESWVSGIDGVPSSWRNTCYWMVFDPEVSGRAWSAWGNKHDLPRYKMFRGGYSGSAGGVAVSDDNCRNWRFSNSGLPSSMVCTHIVLDTSSPSSARTLYACGFREGVYKSTDGGQSWRATGTVPSTNRNYWRLCLLPGGRLFLLIVRDRQGSQSTDGGLFLSDNGGDTWQQVVLPDGVIFPNDLIYDPSNPDRLYLSCWPWMQVGDMYKGNWQVDNVGGGVLLSEDGGGTWRRIFREDAHVYAAAVNPANPATIAINTFDSAAFRSDDSGENWHRIRGYNFKWGYRPVFDPHHPGMIFLTTFGGGVFYGPAEGNPAAFEDIENIQEQWRWGQHD